nr:hypothetical protein [Allomuricauda sp.]
MSDSTSGRTTAILSYITIVGCVIAITMNMEPKNAFARFHIRQAFGVHLLYHGLAIVLTYTEIVQVSLVLFIFYTILIAFGIWSAYQNKQQMLPLIGSYFQKWFTFIR